MWILLIVVVAVVLWFVYSYNGFVKLNTRVTEGWSDIEIQLKRRYDLIPNLVNTVKGYATHESSAFEKVTAARSAAMQAGGLTGKADAENQLTGALKSLFAVSEAYPDLKANTNFLELQRELSDTENKIQAARRFYNSVVRELNIMVDSFPSNIIAGIFHFVKKEFFDLADTDVAQQPVEVKF
ncbi:MAG TPA: LemA family protein [Candidatus Paceibacterota bacterium]